MHSKTTRTRSPRTSFGRWAASLAALGVALGSLAFGGAPAVAATGVGYITIHDETASEDINQDFGYTVSPAAGGVSSFTLNDYTSVALNVNFADVAVSQDTAQQSTLWATDLQSRVWQRAGGTSEWKVVPGATGTRVAGTDSAGSVFVMTPTGVVRAGDVSASYGAPTGCTLTGIASNGTTLLAACGDGRLFRFAGSLSAGGAAANWAQIVLPTTVVVNQVAINAAGTVITSGPSAVNTFTLPAGSSTPTGTPTSSSMGNTTGVAVGTDGRFYRTGGGNTTPSTSTNGTGWSGIPKARQSSRAAAADAGRVWMLNPRGTGGNTTNLGTTLLSRGQDGTYYDDERIRSTGGAGNTVNLAVSAGTYRVTQSTPAGWINQSIVCALPDGTSKTYHASDDAVDIPVAAGQHVVCTFLNVYSASAERITATCDGGYLDTFGTGQPGAVSALAPGLTTYHYNPQNNVGAQTNDGYYNVVTRTSDSANFAGNYTDHTGNANGNMMFVNASYSPGVFYQKRFTNVTTGTPYKFSAWILSANKLDISPDVTFQVVDTVTGEVLSSTSTGPITTAGAWAEHGLTFTPTNGEFILQMVNNSVGGNGNDLAIDDVHFGISCAPVTFAKKLDSARPSDADQYTLEIRNGTPDGPVIGTTTTTGTGVTLANNAVTIQQPIDTTVYLAEKPSGMASFDDYLPSRLTCVDLNGKTTGLPVDVEFSAPVAVKPVASAKIECAVTNVPKKPSITIDKRALTESYAKPGDTIDYAFTVTNTGNETLSDVKVIDTVTPPSTQGKLSAVTCEVTTLKPGESTDCTATYTVTQADVDNGKADDSAVAQGTPPGKTDPVTSDPSTESVPSVPAPELDLKKSTTTTVVTTAGTIVPYVFEVTNTGNVTLTDVQVTDRQQAPALDTALSPITCDPSSNADDAAGTLSPAATMICRADYTVSQADIDHGSITDVAVATGTDPTGEDVPTPERTVTVPVADEPGLSVVKQTAEDEPVVTAAGQTVDYTFLVANTGNKTLTDVHVTDTVAEPSTQANLSEITCDPSSEASDPAGTLSVGATMLCHATYTATQADIDHGSIRDAAVATGTPPVGPPVTTPESPVEVPVDQTPAITVKKATETTSVRAAGDIVPYTFLVQNTGNVTLTGVSVTDTVADPSTQANLSAITCDPSSAGDPAGTLSAGATMLCHATYTVTQADIDHGTVKDAAVATGTPPVGPPVTTPESPVEVPVEQTPALTIVKSTQTTDVKRVGETVDYAFLVTNTGNVTLRDVEVVDTVTAPSTQENLSKLTCEPSSVESDPAGTLSVGATMTCRATYTVTQADIDHGSIRDAAVATGTPPDGPPVTTPESPVEIPVSQTPAIAVVKSADTERVSEMGQKIGYTFVVTNVGNVTLTDVHVTDVQVAPAVQANLTPIVCGPSTTAGDAEGTLSPGAKLTCTATYTVTKADIANGEITDVAVAHGTPPRSDTPVNSPESTVTVVVDTETLSVTGTVLPTVGFIVAVLALIGGGVFVALQRRRRGEAQTSVESAL